MKLEIRFIFCMLIVACMLIFMSIFMSILQHFDKAVMLHGAANQKPLYDQQLISYIRRQIYSPSLTRSRRLSKPKRKDASMFGHSAFVDNLLSGRRNGFFIECGAAEGEAMSNTLFFEVQRNWTGILIEVHPSLFRLLMKKYRRVYAINTCLSNTLQPMTATLQIAGFRSGIVTINPNDSNVKRTIVVKCFPLNVIMTALNVSHVDYLSLDVEGPEIDILRTIDWTRLHIDVIAVEYRVINGDEIIQRATLIKLSQLRTFFRETGLYREVGVLPSGVNESVGLDVVFYRI